MFTISMEQCREWTEMRSMTLLFSLKTIAFPQNNWTLWLFPCSYWFASMTNIISILFDRTANVFRGSANSLEHNELNIVVLKYIYHEYNVQLCRYFTFLSHPRTLKEGAWVEALILNDWYEIKWSHRYFYENLTDRFFSYFFFLCV